MAQDERRPRKTRVQEARALRARAQALLAQSAQLATQGAALLHERGVRAEALDLLQRHATLFTRGMALIEQAQARQRGRPCRAQRVESVPDSRTHRPPPFAEES